MTDFLTAISNAGLTPPPAIIGDGKLYRFAGNGDARKKNAWYIYYDDDYPTGVFGDWKTGLQETWTQKTTRSMTPEEKARHKSRMEESRRIRDAEADRVHAECREWCEREYPAASPAPDDHPYLVKKQIPALGVKLYRDSLMIPVKDRHGKLHGVQFIAPDGTKKFKTGTDKQGHFASIGKPNGTTIICEGYATGASLHLATGYPVLVAFDRTNLIKVAKILRERKPETLIIIAADNDQWTPGNPGLADAAKATRAVNGVLAYPVFADDSLRPTDFNDLHALEGLSAVQATIQQALTCPIPEPVPEYSPPSEPDISELPPPTAPPVKKTPAETTRDLVLHLNDNHFVSSEAGKTYVFSEQWDARMGRNVLLRSSFQDFQNFHLNRLVYSHDDKNGAPVFKPLGDVWLKHSLRRQYEGITLEPGKVTPGYYNLWRGFAVEAKQGKWDLMQDHIFEVVCNADTVLYQYVMGWLATAVQKPGTRAETALVLRGKRGTGKGTLGNYMCRIFGGNSAHIMNSKYLTGNFNSHLRDVVFMFADEAFWAGDKAGESVLKGIITEPTLTIEGKGRDVVFTRNMLHIMMASNSDWVVPAGMEERRFCVLNVTETHMQDKKYFGDIYNQMDHGGVEAMLYDLENMDLSKFDIRTVPHTEGLFEQKLQSLDPFMQWWYGKLCDGEFYKDEGWGRITTQRLYQSYIKTMADQSINHRSSETVIGLKLNKVLPYVQGVRRREATGFGNERERYFFLPDLDECRNHFESLMNCKIEW